MNRLVSAITIFSPSDVTDIEVEYSQTFKHGRTIFGDVVPFGRVWRTGANGNTTIFVSRDVEISGTLLKNGKYALFTVPRPDRWTLIFYTSLVNWGLPRNWEDSKVAFAIEVPVDTLEDVVEALTISIRQKTHFEAALEIAWDKTHISVPFEMPLQRNALNENRLVIGGARFEDLYISSKFHYDVGELSVALAHINIALDANERKPYFYTRLKSLIEAAMGDREAALKSAHESLRGSKAAANEYYVHLNETSIAMWSRDQDGIAAEDTPQ